MVEQMPSKLALLAAALCIPLLAAAVWFVSEPKPGAERFVGKLGTIESVTLGNEQAQAGDFLSQNVQITSSSGVQVEVQVLRPANATGPLPLIVLLAGHRTGRDAVHLLGAPGPFVIAAMNYPYDGPERARGFRQSIEIVQPARKALMETPAAVLLATDWLLEQPWVDKDRAEIAGVSLGMPFAAIAGALEPRFRRVWLIQGGADMQSWLDHNLVDKIPNGFLRHLAAQLLHRVIRGSLFEPSYWAPRSSPRPVVIIASRDDKRLPVRLVDELGEVITGPKEIIWMEGGHVDRRPEAVAEILGLVRDRMSEPTPGRE